MGQFLVGLISSTKLIKIFTFIFKIFVLFVQF